MTKMECCRCGGDCTTVMACSGASNVGQMSNEVAKRLDAEGTARFFCLAGLGGHVGDMVVSTAAADRVLVIDGCPTGCGKLVVDAAGLTGYAHVVLTELGIEKEHVFAWSDADLDTALDVCRKLLREMPDGGRGFDNEDLPDAHDALDDPSALGR